MQTIKRATFSVIFAAAAAAMLASTPSSARALESSVGGRVYVDSMAIPDTTQVLLTEDGVKNLVTFWHIFLQDPYARRVTLSSVEYVHGAIMIRGKTGKCDGYSVNLPLIAARVPSIATALASAKLSLAQVQQLTWSLHVAGITLRSNRGRGGNERNYVPTPAESATVVWKNVDFLQKHYDTSKYEEAKILNDPSDTTSDPDTRGVQGMLINAGGDFMNYVPLPATPVFDSTQIVCDATHPCSLAIGAYQNMIDTVTKKVIGSKPVPSTKICVHGTTNCVVTSNGGGRSPILGNLPVGDVVLDVHADGFTDRSVTFPVLYRYQGSGGVGYSVFLAPIPAKK